MADLNLKRHRALIYDFIFEVYGKDMGPIKKKELSTLIITYGTLAADGLEEDNQTLRALIRDHKCK